MYEMHSSCVFSIGDNFARTKLGFGTATRPRCKSCKKNSFRFGVTWSRDMQQKLIVRDILFRTSDTISILPPEIIRHTTTEACDIEVRFVVRADLLGVDEENVVMASATGDIFVLARNGLSARQFRFNSESQMNPLSFLCGLDSAKVCIQGSYHNNHALFLMTLNGYLQVLHCTALIGPSRLAPSGADISAGEAKMTTLLQTAHAFTLNGARIPLPENATCMRSYGIVMDGPARPFDALVAIGSREGVSLYGYCSSTGANSTAELTSVFSSSERPELAPGACVHSLDFCHASHSWRQVAADDRLQGIPEKRTMKERYWLIKTAAFLIVGLDTGAIEVYRYEHDYLCYASADEEVPTCSRLDVRVDLVDAIVGGSPPLSAGKYMGPACVRALPRHCIKDFKKIPTNTSNLSFDKTPAASSDKIDSKSDVVDLRENTAVNACLDKSVNESVKVGENAECAADPLIGSNISSEKQPNVSEELGSSSSSADVHGKDKHHCNEADSSEHYSEYGYGENVSGLGECVGQFLVAWLDGRLAHCHVGTVDNFVTYEDNKNADSSDTSNVLYVWSTVRCLHTPDSLCRMDFFSESIKPPSTTSVFSMEGEAHNNIATDVFMDSDGRRYVSCAVASWSGHTYIVHVLIHEKRHSHDDVAAGVAQKDEVIYCFDSRLLLSGGANRAFCCAVHSNSPSLMFVSTDDSIQVATDIKNQLKKFKEPRMVLLPVKKQQAVVEE